MAAKVVDAAASPFGEPDGAHVAERVCGTRA